MAVASKNESLIVRWKNDAAARSTAERASQGSIPSQAWAHPTRARGSRALSAWYPAACIFTSVRYARTAFAGDASNGGCTPT